MFPPAQTSRARQRRVLWCLLFCWGLVFSSPLIAHQSLTAVCATNGIQWVDADGGPDGLHARTLDCALCLPAALPAPEAAPAFAERPPLHLRVMRDGRRAPPAPLAMPPPARGPPVSLTATQVPTQEVYP